MAHGPHESFEKNCCDGSSSFRDSYPWQHTVISAEMGLGGGRGVSHGQVGAVASYCQNFTDALIQSDYDLSDFGLGPTVII